jgi:hypothetical protein
MGFLKNENEPTTLDIIAYLFLPHRDDDILLSVGLNPILYPYNCNHIS